MVWLSLTPQSTLVQFRSMNNDEHSSLSLPDLSEVCLERGRTAVADLLPGDELVKAPLVGWSVGQDELLA